MPKASRKSSPKKTINPPLHQQGPGIRHRHPLHRTGRRDQHRHALYNYTLTSTPLTEETLAQADCLLLATDHDAYDPNFILQHARLIVDTRDFFPADTPEAADKLYKA